VRLTADRAEKLEALKNTYEGETAFILSCGPSFKDFVQQPGVREILADRLVLAVKQTAAYFPCDFLLYNAVRLGGVFNSGNEIIRVAICDPNVKRVGYAIQGCPDIWLPVDVTENRTWIVQDMDWSRGIIQADRPNAWGPGILLVGGLWFALHLGVSRIVTIGWDCSDGYKHFYDEEEASITETEKGVIPTESACIRRAIGNLLEWLDKRGVDLVQYGPCSALTIPKVGVEDLDYL
jgi:hypothetical protein